MLAVQEVVVTMQAGLSRPWCCIGAVVQLLQLTPPLVPPFSPVGGYLGWSELAAIAAGLFANNTTDRSNKVFQHPQCRRARERVRAQAGWHVVGSFEGAYYGTLLSPL